MELLAKINGCFNTLGEEHKIWILLEFIKNPFFVDNQIDIPRLYNMCMEAQEHLLKSKDKNLVQEDSDDDETVALIVETKKILEKLGEEKKTMILKEWVNLPGDDLDFVFIHDRALAELAKIKGKSTIFNGDRAKTIPRIHKKEVEKRKLLHDAIKIGEKRGRSDEDGDYEQEEEKRLATVVVNNYVVPPPRYDLPGALKKIMARENGTNVVLVIQKHLSQTDVNRNHGRLSLPQVNDTFLSHEEKENLFKETTEKRKSKVEAKMLEPNGEVCIIYLTKWNMRGSAIYNLITTWNDVVSRNRLREGLEVQLWSFRGAGSQLWFALVRIS